MTTDTASYLDDDLRTQCTRLALDNRFRMMDPKDTDQYGDPRFAELVMMVPPLHVWHSPPPPSPPTPLSPTDTVDYEPAHWPPPGWLHMGEGWYEDVQ